MESIINQVFWLWVPLALLPIWLRIGLTVFLVILVTRPIIIRLTPRLIQWTAMLLAKGVELLSYPVMLGFHRYLAKQRENGSYHIPVWIEGSEEVFALLIKGLTKVQDLSRKRKRNSILANRIVRTVAIMSAILLPLAVVNNPTASYSETWHRFDNWVTAEKVEKELGFQLSDTQNKILGRVNQATAKINPIEFVLTKDFKEGGNIRSTPSLKGKIVGNFSSGEVVTYLGEEEYDETGIRWLKVETPSGKIGWVSSRIVVKK